MSDWNKEQWGAQQPPQYQQNSAPYPGPTPNYGGPSTVQQAPKPSQQEFEGERFKPRKKVNDPIFLMFFVLQFLGFVALSAIAIHTWAMDGGLGGGLGKSGGTSGTSVTLNSSTVYLLLLVTAAAILLSSVYLILARAFTRFIMHITLLLSIALNIGICVYYWITKYYSGAIIFTIIALLGVLNFQIWFHSFLNYIISY